MKKILAIMLAAMMILSCVSVVTVFAETTENAPKGVPSSIKTYGALYVHAVSDSNDADAWQAWQSVHDDSLNESNTNVKYFFLPTSAGSTVDIYNAFSTKVIVNSVEIPPQTTKTVGYNVNSNYSVTADGKTYTLRYMKSSAEAAVYINNPNADGNGSDLMSYLNVDKSRSAKATGAIVSPDGKIDNTTIKKIKGRGNTTWAKSKKAYNITYDKKVSIGGMAKNKKYSILANYQDDSLSRNRFLYDLSDAVGMPYASDSRYVDFYVDGYYWGSYQMCEKIEAETLVEDVAEDDYLNEDGTLKEDFSFIAEVDGSAGADDYYVQLNNGVKITLKSPEIEPGNVGYNEVKAYVKEKFENFTTIAKNKTKKVSDVADLDSVTKLYLINELGKNWDSGVSSTFFTYKPDEDGNYKFYGSPVWDYDNSLGNAVGVSGDLRYMGVDDYTEYTGWWCKFKGKSASSRGADANIINNLANNNEVLEAAARIWFEDFVPAIEHFSGNKINGVINEELYTAKNYYKNVLATANMNYTSGWLLNTGGWIADHSTLNKASFDYDTMTYTVNSAATHYANNFTGMYNYAVDWMTSRAAWLSNEMKSQYTPEKILVGDADLNGVVNVNDATLVQRYCAGIVKFTAKQFAAADVEGDGRVVISDATNIQRIVADMPIVPSAPAPEEPDVDPEEPDFGDGEEEDVNKDTYTVTFTNALNWSGRIYCYYYKESDNGSVTAPTAWPGNEMTYFDTNEFDEDMYRIEVPKNMNYIIFSNGSVQTEKIPFDGSDLRFYTVNKTSERGRYYTETW